MLAYTRNCTRSRIKVEPSNLRALLFFSPRCLINIRNIKVVRGMKGKAWVPCKPNLKIRIQSAPPHRSTLILVVHLVDTPTCTYLSNLVLPSTFHYYLHFILHKSISSLSKNTRKHKTKGPTVTSIF